MSNHIIGRLEVSIENPYNDVCVALIEKLWFDLGALYGDLGPCRFRPEDVAGPDARFLIAWLDKEPVGCGAIRDLQTPVAEVKRMYVVPEARRRGVALAILNTLEHLAAEANCPAIRLETGTKQPGAIQLYERAGYQHIPCYEPYTNDPLSVCFVKSLR